ncbi:Solute symporter protein [Halomonas sp. NYA30]
MRRLIVLPTSRAGWGLLIAFVALMAAGTWPVIGLVNRATLVMGLPLMVVWSYLVIFACVVVMLIGNRIVERDDYE